VLIRFTYLFSDAYRVMPPDRPSGGPTNWDHSYYALIWHTWRFNPIVWHVRRIPKTLANTVDASGRLRVELWWLRPSAYGWGSVLCFAVLPIAAAVVGVVLLARASSASDEDGLAAPERADRALETVPD
jgi:hypothetical protein